VTHTNGHPDIASLYAGDFNCQYVDWGYSTTSDGESPPSWEIANNPWLLKDPKRLARYSSH